MTDPALPHHTRTVIHESAFSRYVTNHYGRPYHLQQQGDMMGQEVSTRFTVPDPEDGEWEGMEAPTLVDWLKATPPTDEHDRTEILRWERDYYPQLGAVVNDLHTKGLLDAGEYLIYAEW